MKLIVHDLGEEKFRELSEGSGDNMTVVSDDGTIKSCIGCFGCWIKTPGTCVIRDKYGDMGELISKCDEFIIISKNFYGGFSPFVKNVLDRSISYIHPYFRIVKGEMHHKRRYDNHFELKVCFYGESITEAERRTAEKLVEANALNFDCSVKGVAFAKGPEEIKDFLLHDLRQEG